MAKKITVKMMKALEKDGIDEEIVAKIREYLDIGWTEFVEDMLSDKQKVYEFIDELDNKDENMDVAYCIGAIILGAIKRSSTPAAYKEFTKMMRHDGVTQNLICGMHIGWTKSSK